MNPSPKNTPSPRPCPYCGEPWMPERVVHLCAVGDPRDRAERGRERLYAAHGVAKPKTEETKR